jgi:hypothetical protein
MAEVNSRSFGFGEHGSLGEELLSVRGTAITSPIANTASSTVASVFASTRKSDGAVVPVVAKTGGSGHPGAGRNC